MLRALQSSSSLSSAQRKAVPATLSSTGATVGSPLPSPWSESSHSEYKNAMAKTQAEGKRCFMIRYEKVMCVCRGGSSKEHARGRQRLP